jgi:CRP-like cAMP-binding protein
VQKVTNSLASLTKTIAQFWIFSCLGANVETKLLPKLSREYVEQLLSGIHFFKLVKQQDPQQFEFLLQAAKIVSYHAGEVVVRKGDLDNWLYFLLKGSLAVYANDPLHGELINHITPGEVFGELSQLLGRARTANVLAEANTKETVVLAIDARMFSNNTSYPTLSIQTKLAYFRNAVHSLRWKLEVYRSQYLHHALANKHHQVKLYIGEKDTPQELQALQEQALALAKLLLEWNEEFGAEHIGIA